MIHPLGVEQGFALHYTVSWRPLPVPWKQKEIFRRLAETVRTWDSWSELHQRYDGPWSDLVHHSGRVLKGLTYQPTGAIVAAPTTSLPEVVGGARNWDYRYGWIRDASLTMNALWVAACPDEAGRFLDWITGAAGTSLHQEQGIQIMYGVGGEHDLTERELPHLAGWRAPQPSRAGRQRGVEATPDRRLRRAARRRAPPARRDRRAGRGDGRVPGRRGRRRRRGVAPTRPRDLGDPRRDPPLRLLEAHVLGGARPGRPPGGLDGRNRTGTGLGGGPGRGARRHPRPGLERRGGGLHPGLRERRPRRLRPHHGHHRLPTRRRSPDASHHRRRGHGLPGGESTFILCTYWLVECWAMAGEVARAREIFERVTAYANDVGLLDEEAEPVTGELLGNFPQAFRHVGLVNAAWAISEAESAARQRP